MWAISKRVGERVGAGLYIAASALVVGAVVLNPVTCLAGAVVAGVSGAVLRNKLYLDDPEARAEYAASFRQDRFSVSLKKLSNLASILRVVELTDVAAKWDEEFSRDRYTLSLVLERLSEKQLAELLAHSDSSGFVTIGQLYKAFQRDLQTAKGSFTQLWMRFEPLDGASLHRVHRLFQSSPMELSKAVAELRSLFQLEFAPLLEASELRSNAIPPASLAGAAPTAPPDDEQREGYPLGVYEALSRYHSFVRQVLDIPRDDLQRIVRRCDETKQHDYTVLLSKGLLCLYQGGCVELHLIQEKSALQITALPATRSSLKLLESDVSLHTQLQERFIEPAMLVRDVFTASIPSSPFGYCDGEPNAAILDFLEEREALLTAFGQEIVDRRYWPALLNVKSSWEKAQRQAERVHVVPRDVETVLASSKPDSVSEVSWSEKVAAARVTRDRVQEQRRRFLLDARKEIHSSFCSDMAMMHTASQLSTTVVNCSLM